MCHEASTQMETILEGVKPSQTTKGLKLLAVTQDKNFMQITTQLEDIKELLENQRKEYLDGIKNLKTELSNSCILHKEDLDNQFKSLKKDTEVVLFFSKHQKIFNGIIKVVSISLLIIITYIISNRDLLQVLLNSLIKKGS